MARHDSAPGADPVRPEFVRAHPVAPGGEPARGQRVRVFGGRAQPARLRRVQWPAPVVHQQPGPHAARGSHGRRHQDNTSRLDRTVLVCLLYSDFSLKVLLNIRLSAIVVNELVLIDYEVKKIRYIKFIIFINWRKGDFRLKHSKFYERHCFLILYIISFKVMKSLDPHTTTINIFVYVISFIKAWQ